MKCRWILQDTNSLPSYQGESSDLGQACMTAPQPKLKNASHLSTNTSETVMDWPFYDAYYSNCNQGTYCDKANMCVKQLSHGEVCESNSQCLSGLVCNQSTCQDVSSVSVPSSSATSTYDSGGASTYNTVHIILTVVGIVLFLSLLVIGFFILKRKKDLRRSMTSSDKEQQQQHNIPPPAVRTVTTTRSNSSSSTASLTASSLRTNQQMNRHNVTNILQPDYESTFNNTTTTHSSPSQQQQELQFQLLKIQHPAPPPYSP